MSKQLYIPVLVTGLSTKVDGSVKVVLETREVTGQTAADLFDLRGYEAWCVLSPTEMKEIEIPKGHADAGTNQKSQAERMRAVIWRIWEKKGKKGDSDIYYKQTMEKLIEKLKEQLDE